MFKISPTKVMMNNEQRVTFKYNKYQHDSNHKVF